MPEQLVFESDADRTSGTPSWNSCFDLPPWHSQSIKEVHGSRASLGDFWLHHIQQGGSVELPAVSSISEAFRSKTVEAFQTVYVIWTAVLQISASACPSAAEGPPKETWTVNAPEKMIRIWDTASRRKLLENALRNAEWLLSLDEDWDDEGGQKYSKETLDRALMFVRNHMRWAREEFQAELPIPRILPGPNGSIDLHWKTNVFELLLNVPPEPGLATFYGDDLGKVEIRGHLDPKVFNLGLISWLIRRQAIGRKKKYPIKTRFS